MNMDQTLKVRAAQGIAFNQIERLLIRGTNWIGDAVMTLPAVAAIRKSFLRARISILVKPWVAELFYINPNVDEVILFHDPGIHSGIMGKFKLSMELRERHFDAAILLQNAIEAAIIAKLAGIPIRAGYNSDVRGMLLTHSVQRTPAIRAVHQVDYYLEMVKSLGCQSAGRDIDLRIPEEYRQLGDTILAPYGLGRERFLVGMAPGATYGPAKKWFPERFAEIADRLMERFPVQVLLFGSASDRDSIGAVARNAKHELIDLTGKTSLKEAISLISRCRLFISNDSGLMHIAGALDIPTIAIFGSTNPITTSPMGSHTMVIRKDVSCSPCLKVSCPTDFRCMDLIKVNEVYHAAEDMLQMS
jgi:heptosyltransferase II